MVGGPPFCARETLLCYLITAPAHLCRSAKESTLAGKNVPKRSKLCSFRVALRKQAYSNILETLTPKNENFQIKNFDILHISAQNIDCGYSLEPPRRGGSNEYHNLCF